MTELNNNSYKDKRDIIEFIAEANRNIRLDTFYKSKKYNFDFELGQPLNLPSHQIDWEMKGSELNNSLRISTLSTINSITDSEFWD